MYPHERSLVEKYQDKPFVILGVNSDANRELVKDASIKEKLTWRSFFDGGSTQGPIASKWNVTAWPTVYLIDHKGAIVGRIGGMSKEDEELIAQAVKEAEDANKK
jgi:glutathione peroxidase-family protein